MAFNWDSGPSGKGLDPTSSGKYCTLIILTLLVHSKITLL